MLKQFGVLPGEKRALELSERDILYCLLQQWLDAEEELEQLCPACRERTLEQRCIACGTRLEDTAAAVNGSFDTQRFLHLRGGNGGVSE